MDELICALCLYVRTSPPADAQPAVTVIRGYAVCHDHLGYLAHGTEWHQLVQAVHHRGVTESGDF